MEHIHTGPPSTCMFQGRDQGRHPALPPLHTGYDCCTCMRKKQKTKFKYKLKLHEFETIHLSLRAETSPYFDTLGQHDKNK